MVRLPNLVRLYLSALQLSVQPSMPTIGPLETRWRHDIAIGPVGGRRSGLPKKSAMEGRPGIRRQPASR